MSSSGHNKTTGQPNSIIGTFQETRLTVAGKKRHAEGETEARATKARLCAQETLDRIVGKKDNIIGAITRDKAQQAKVEQEIKKPVR